MKNTYSSKQIKLSFDIKSCIISLIILASFILSTLDYPLFHGLSIALIIYLSILNRNKPKSNSTCNITIKENSFIYKELNSDYQVEINFNKIKNIESTQFRNFNYVIISMVNNFELTCANLDNQDDFINIVRAQANL